MLSKVIIKKKNVFPIVLLTTIIPNFIIDANCSSNMINNYKETINKSEKINSKNLSNEEKIDNKNTLNECKQLSLCDNNALIKIGTKFHTDDSNKTISDSNTLSIDYVLRLLWNSYKNITSIPNDSNQIHIISIHDNVIQQYIDNIKETNNKLFLINNEFNSIKNTETQRRNYILDSIKRVQNNTKKTVLHNFLKKEIAKFPNYIENVINIAKQHENIYSIKAIIDTYFKMQDVLLNNINREVLTISTDYKDVSNKLNIFQQEISENINSFYDSCLIGQNLNKESIDDKLETINNKIIKLETNPANISNIIKIVNKLEIDNNSQDVLNKLKLLQSKVEELITNEKLQNIKKDLTLLNKKIFKLILNANLHTIRNNLNETNALENMKTIIPTTSNILCWCSENYEDWAEILSQYEDEIIDIFKNKINSGQISKQEFANTFFLLHKVTNINAKMENYYHTAELLCNLSPIKQPHPIILPRSLAV